jgi:hypothetical protein
MRPILLPLLCLLSTATASALPQNRGPPPGKGPGGPGKGFGGPGGPGKGFGGPGGEPPIEKYIARITNDLARLDNGLRSVPRGGSTQDAQRITGDLMKIQGIIISDMREGTREIRTWGGPPLTKGILIANSLVTTGQKLTSAMRSWASQKEMVQVSGNINAVVSQLDSFEGALVLFYDGIGAKIGIINQGSIMNSKNIAKEDVVRAIDALR